jgi:8-oxo-dGTP pyrophosphatase MutT (NUDIX family)
MPGAKSIAVARPAATVVILRDGRQGLEVFMVVRHHEIDFSSGALVFPGGKVDGQDKEPAWSEFAAFGSAAMKVPNARICTKCSGSMREGFIYDQA